MSGGFYIKQGDTLPVIEATLLDAGGNPINLQGTTVWFRMGGHVDAPAEVVDAAQGKVRYVWADGDTDVPGAHKGEFHVQFSGGGKQTVPNTGYVIVMIERTVI